MKNILTDSPNDWHKKIVHEWHPTLNGNLKPSDVVINSHKKVWWRCSCGHEWQDSIKNRSMGRGCPYDMGKRIPRVADRPILAAEWHPTRNTDLEPSKVDIFSNRLVWWQCKEGHEWQATVQSRANGSGCPYDV